MLLQRFSFFVRTALIGITVMLLITCSDGGIDGPGDGIPGIDTIPPAAVDGLFARYPTTHSISLTWFSPGDDGNSGRASAYDVRWARSPLTESNWDTATPITGVPAPKPARQVETFKVTGLPSEEDIYFALKTSDEAQNESDISNWSMSATLDVPPSSITDLTAVAISDTEFRLTWTATGDNEVTGTAAQYDIRYATYPINDYNWHVVQQVDGEPAPKAAGETETFTVTGLDPLTNYCFAIKTCDDADNWSSLSDVSFGKAYGLSLWITPRQVYSSQQLLIEYRASPDYVTRINIWAPTLGPPVQFVVRKHLVSETLPPGTIYEVYWDLLDDDGNPMWPDWNVQCTVELLWGESSVGSETVRILQ